MARFSRHALQAARVCQAAGAVPVPAVVRSLALEPLRALQRQPVAVVSECPHCAMDYAVAAGEAVMCRRCGEWVATVARGAE